MKSGNTGKVILAVVLLAGAAFGFFRFFNQKSGVAEETFYYDLSTKKLFSAARESLPPIKGLDNPEEDAVRAVVICPSDKDPNVEANRSIAYLEKYAPELKKNIEEARVGKAEAVSTQTRNNYRFVSIAGEVKWHVASSPEGKRIMTSWHVAGADGNYPTVCSP
jgi:hypothetical protein